MLHAITTMMLRAFSTFYPTQKPLVFSGKEASLKLANYMLLGGAQRPLIIADRFLIENGMLDDLISLLENKQCNVSVFDGIVPNPTFEVIEAGLKISRDNDCDAVFVVGGGSAIDAAKVIAAASTNRRPVENLAGILKVRKPLLPFYVVPTTSGTGSEVTSAAVISDNKNHQKRFFVDPKYIPVATAFDTALLKSLPPAITAATGMDALTHAIEAYTSRNHFADSDRDALMAIRLLFQFLPIAFQDGNDENAREMVALASFLAGYAFNRAGLGYVHAISHQVSAHYNTPHGLVNAVILPRVLRFNRAVCAQRFATLERALAGIDREQKQSHLGLAERFISRVENLSDLLDIPLNLKELNTKDFDSISHAAMKEARNSYAVPKVMNQIDVLKVLDSVYSGNRAVSFI